MLKLSLVSLGAQATLLGNIPPRDLAARVEASPHWLERGEAAETQRGVEGTCTCFRWCRSPPRLLNVTAQPLAIVLS